MSIDAHHRSALIETAQLELDRAHRGALAMDGGEVRRALELALTALKEAASLQPADPSDGGAAVPVSDTIGALQAGLDDLETGSLAELGQIIETSRNAIA